MTNTDTTPGTAAEPIHWSKLIDVREGTAPDAKTAAADFAAQYLAHSRAFHTAIKLLIGALGTDDEADAAEGVRLSTWTDIPAMRAAFTAAALLRGWDSGDAVQVANDPDGNEAMDEWAWEWLFEVYTLPEGSDARGIYERLTTVPPAPELRNERQDETPGVQTSVPDASGQCANREHYRLMGESR